jgi:hypothetical protein
MGRRTVAARMARSRTAIAEENSLDKEATSYDDILDSYQLALKNYAFTEDINSH